MRIASQAAEQLKTKDLRKTRNIRKISKLHRMIVWCPVILPKWKFRWCWQKTFDKQTNFFRSALFHMKTRVSLKYFVNDCLWHKFWFLTFRDHFKLNFAGNFGNSKSFHTVLTYHYSNYFPYFPRISLIRWLLFWSFHWGWNLVIKAFQVCFKTFFRKYEINSCLSVAVYNKSSS